MYFDGSLCISLKGEFNFYFKTVHGVFRHGIQKHNQFSCTCYWRGNVVTDRAISGLIHGCAVGFFFSKELLHGMYVFQCTLSMFCPVLFFGGPYILLTIDQEGPPIVPVLLYVIHRKVVHYTTLTCNSLLSVENKRKRKQV